MESEFQQQQGQGIGIGDYLSVFSRRAWLIVIPFLAVLGIAAAFAFLLPPQFEATTVMVVEDTSAVDAVYSNVDIVDPVKPLLTTIKQVVLRRAFLEDLVDRNNIREGYDVNNARDKTRLFSQYILQRLKVRLVQQEDGLPDIIAIEYQGRDGSRVANFVNDVRQKYEKWVLDRRRRRVRKRLDDLEARLKKQERVAQAKEAEYERFQRETDFQLIGAKTYADKRIALATNRQDLANEEVREAQLVQELDQVSAELNAEPKLVESSQTVQKSVAWVDQYGKVRDLEAQLRTLRERFYENYPPVVALKKIVDLEKDKLGQIPEFDASQRTTNVSVVWQGLSQQEDLLKAQLRGSKARIVALQSAGETLAGQVDMIPALNRRADELARSRGVAVDQLQVLSARTTALRSTWNRLNSPDGNIFRVLEAPLPEEAQTWDPVFPSVPLFVGIGAFIGLLIGTGVAFLVEFSSSSFVTVNQLRRTLPVAVIGQMGVLRTKQEIRARRTKRVFVGMTALAIVAVVVYGHVCYFDSDYRANLPTWLFKVMKGFYGSQ